MIRWLRVVLPPGWVLLLAGLLFTAGEVSCLFTEWRLGAPFFSQKYPLGRLLLNFILGLYGAYRVVAFHPGYRPGYYDWLATTPWTNRKPLPFGPIHLVWQDVVLVGLAVVLNWPRMQTQTIDAVPIFFLAYLALLGFAHFYTGEKLCAYAIGFGAGLIMRFWSEPLVVLATIGTGYGLGFFALSHALARFPWDPESLKNLQNFAINLSGENVKQENKAMGWPYDRVGPKFAYLPSIGLPDTFLGGLLYAWWIYALDYQQQLAPGGRSDTGYWIYFLFLIFGVALRLFIYCNGYLPPVSLFGRLLRGRLLIPGYDKIFVAPFLAVLVGVGVIYAISWGFEPLIVKPVAFTLTWWILFGMGPTLKDWWLTGNHRIVPGFLGIARTR